MLLHIGVIDVPEFNDKSTTGTVADVLETKYGLFSNFADSNLGFIADELANGMADAIDALMNGQHINPYAGACSAIDQKFKEFLDTEEMAKIGVAGVPTKAAVMGVNSRLKAKRGPRRPSFIDSGTLRTNLISWIEE